MPLCEKRIIDLENDIAGVINRKSDYKFFVYYENDEEAKNAKINVPDIISFIDEGIQLMERWLGYFTREALNKELHVKNSVELFEQKNLDRSFLPKYIGKSHITTQEAMRYKRQLSDIYDRIIDEKSVYYVYRVKQDYNERYQTIVCEPVSIDSYPFPKISMIDSCEKLSKPWKRFITNDDGTIKFIISEDDPVQRLGLTFDNIDPLYLNRNNKGELIYEMKHFYPEPSDIDYIMSGHVFIDKDNHDIVDEIEGEGTNKYYFCQDCGQVYVITWRSELWFKKKGFQIPKRCEKCRKAARKNKSAD